MACEQDRIMCLIAWKSFVLANGHPKGANMCRLHRVDRMPGDSCANRGWYINCGNLSCFYHTQSTSFKTIALPHSLLKLDAYEIEFYDCENMLGCPVVFEQLLDA